MRDSVIIQQFELVAKQLQLLENSIRLGVSGEAIRNQAVTDLLIKKGLFTQEEFTAAVGEVIRKAQEKSESKKEEEIIKPTPEQVADIQKSVEADTTPQI